jgi:Terminase large subunit, T4likevirus-type, N-terminal
MLLCCARQTGKTTTVGLIALHTAIYAGPSLVLVIAPSLRQSSELIRRIKGFHAALGPAAPELALESVTKIELASGSRIVALPGANAGDTVRGYAHAAAVIVDECARCSDDLLTAVRPALATNRDGRLICLSTPAGRRGKFFEWWHHGEDWHRVKVTASQCQRISAEFLDAERRELGEMMYRQEYDPLDFIDDGESAFASELVERALSAEVLPLWSTTA